MTKHRNHCRISSKQPTRTVNMFGTLWKVSVILMLSCFHGYLCCSCLPTHPQQQFCNSDFVIRARALSRTEEEVPVENGFGTRTKAVYNVKVLEGFKFDGTCIDYDSVKLYTAVNSALCGVYMDIDSEYLLTGTNKNGRREIHSCSLNSKWEYLDNCTKKNLLNDVYKQNCLCNVTSCFGKECNTVPNGDCVYNITKRENWSSVCKAKETLYNGLQCSWTPCGDKKPIVASTTTRRPFIRRPTTIPFIPFIPRLRGTTEFPMLWNPFSF